ncbi:MAG: NAD(+)/NADH kinase [candidate division WOR-3 bacterium]
MKVGVFGNSSYNLSSAIERIKSVFKEVYISESIGGIYSDKELNEICDVIISLGGDGTLLRCAKKFKKPIIGIKFGKLGFLTFFDIDDIELIKDALLSGNYYLDRRDRLKLYIDGIEVDSALNDFSVNTISGRVVEIIIKTRNSIITSFYGDGVIISSPSGSTAYNLSAGGPILHPSVKAYIITPICPHNLSARPIVLPKEIIINITVKPKLGKWRINSDGELLKECEGALSFDVELSDEKTSLIKLNKTEDFFDILRKKLNWR